MSSPKTKSAKRRRKKASGSSGLRGLIWTIVILILILVILAFVYLFLNRQAVRQQTALAASGTAHAAQSTQQAEEAAASPAAQTAAVSAAPAPTESASPAPAEAAASDAEDAAAASAAEAPAASAKPADEDAADEEASSAEEVSPSPSPSAKASGKAALQTAAKSVTISFAGDCTFASYYGAAYSNTFEAVYEKNGEAYFFQNVKKYFATDDLTVVNLEGTFTTSTDRVYKSYNFKSDPSYVGILDAGDIECVNIANNHSHDYSDSGYQETISTLDKDGIRWFGGEDTCLMEVSGVKIGFSGIYECEDGLSCMDQAVQNVEDLKAAGAEVIVCEFHWGDELSYAPNNTAITLAHAVIDAGADLVIGHHPHVLQGIELYNGKYICYSLGNFCFGGSPGSSDYTTMIFQTTFEVTNGKAADNADFTIIPCYTSTTTTQNTYCPTPATGEQAEYIIDRIYRICGYVDGGITADTPNQTVILEPDPDDPAADAEKAADGASGTSGADDTPSGTAAPDAADGTGNAA